MKKLEHYYNRLEVQEILGCGINYAQREIRNINNALARKGKIIRVGYVPKKVFNDLHGI